MKTAALTITVIAAIAAIASPGWFFLLFVFIAAFAWWFAGIASEQTKDLTPFEFEYNGRLYTFCGGHVYDDEGVTEINDAYVIAEGWKRFKQREK